MRNPCAVLIFDRKASIGGSVVIRPCGASNTHTVRMNGDYLFAVCSRHNDRLRRAGIADADSAY